MCRICGSSVEHDDEDGHRVALDLIVGVKRLALEEGHEDGAAVERRKRNEVEEGERQVDEHKDLEEVGHIVDNAEPLG